MVFPDIMIFFFLNYFLKMTGRENQEESKAETEDIYYKSYTIQKKLHTRMPLLIPCEQWKWTILISYIPLFYRFPSVYHVDMDNSYIPLWVYVLFFFFLEKWYVYNIFTTNSKWQVVTGYYY